MAADLNKFKEKPFFLTWWFEWIILALCFLGGWGLWQLVDHRLMFAFQDDPRYLVLATEVLAGRWDALFADAQFNTPPLYPAMLSAVLPFLGVGTGQTALQALIAPAKELNFALYAVSIALVYQFLAPRIRKPYSFIIAVLYALSPLTVMAAGSIGPDMTYTAVSLMALLVADRALVEKGSGMTKWDLAMVGLWLAAAILTRHSGLALLLAFFLTAWYRLGTRRSFVLLAVFMVLLAPWYLGEVFYRSFHAPAAGIATSATVAAPASLRDRRALFEGSFISHSLSRFRLAEPMQSPLEAPARFGDRLGANADQTLRLMTRSTLGTLDLTYVDNAFVHHTPVRSLAVDFAETEGVRWAVGGFVLLGLLYGFYLFSGLPSTYLALVLLLQWLFPTPEGVSVLPILPLMLFFLFFGVMRVGEMLKQVHLPVSKVLAPTLTVLIGLSSLNGHLAHIRETRPANGAGQNPGQQPAIVGAAAALAETPQTPQKVVPVERVARWLATHTPQQARIAATGAKWASLLSGRPVRILPDGPVAPEVLAETDYVLEERAAAADRAYLVPALQARQPAPRLVYDDPAGGIRIWEILRPSA